MLLRKGPSQPAQAFISLPFLLPSAWKVGIMPGGEAAVLCLWDDKRAKHDKRERAWVSGLSCSSPVLLMLKLPEFLCPTSKKTKNSYLILYCTHRTFSFSSWTLLTDEDINRHFLENNCKWLMRYKKMIQLNRNWQLQFNISFLPTPFWQSYWGWG